MKVLHITPMYPTESNPGFGSFVKTQIDSLRSLVDIDLLVLPGSGGVAPYIKSLPLIKRKLNGSFDVLHLHFGHVSTMIKMIYSGKAPVITSYCGSDLFGKIGENGHISLKSKFLSGMNHRSSNSDFCSIVKSRQLGDALKGHSSNIEIIPNGVDAEQFKELDSKLCKKELGLDPAKRTIFFPADPETRVKNFELLRSVMNQLDANVYQLLTFNNNYKILHEKVPVYLNAADLIVLTSLHEGSSNVIKESLACNKVVFSTDVGDSKWLLDGVNNSVIIPYDPNSLKASIEVFFDEGNKMEPNSRSVFFDKGLDVSTIANRIVDIYSQALNERR